MTSYRVKDTRTQEERIYEQYCTFKPQVNTDSPFVSERTLRTLASNRTRAPPPPPPLFPGQIVTNVSGNNSVSSGTTTPVSRSSRRSGMLPKTFSFNKNSLSASMSGMYTKLSGLIKGPPTAVGIPLYAFDPFYPPNFITGKYGSGLNNANALNVSAHNLSLPPPPPANESNVTAVNPAGAAASNKKTLEAPPLPPYLDESAAKKPEPSTTNRIVINKTAKKEPPAKEGNSWNQLLQEMMAKRNKGKGLKETPKEEKRAPPKSQEQKKKKGPGGFKDIMEELNYKLSRLNSAEEKDKEKDKDSETNSQDLEKRSEDGQTGPAGPAEKKSKLSNPMPKMRRKTTKKTDAKETSDSESSPAVSGKKTLKKPTLDGLLAKVSNKPAGLHRSATAPGNLTLIEEDEEDDDVKAELAGAGETETGKSEQKEPAEASPAKKAMLSAKEMLAGALAKKHSIAAPPAEEKPAQPAAPPAPASVELPIGKLAVSRNRSVKLPAPPPLPSSMPWPPAIFQLSAEDRSQLAGVGNENPATNITTTPSAGEIPATTPAISEPAMLATAGAGELHDLPEGYFMPAAGDESVDPYQILRKGETSWELIRQLGDAGAGQPRSSGNLSTGSPDLPDSPGRAGRLQLDETAFAEHSQPDSAGGLRSRAKLTVSDLPIPANFSLAVKRLRKSNELRANAREFEKRLELRSDYDHPPASAGKSVHSSGQSRTIAGGLSSQHTVAEHIEFSSDRHFRSKASSCREPAGRSDQEKLPKFHRFGGVVNDEIYARDKSLDTATVFWMRSLRARSVSPGTAGAARSTRNTSKQQPPDAPSSAGGSQQESARETFQKRVRAPTLAKPPALRTEELAGRREAQRQQKRVLEEQLRELQQELLRAKKAQLMQKALEHSTSYNTPSHTPSHTTSHTPSRSHVNRVHERMIEKYSNRPDTGYVNLTSLTQRAYESYHGKRNSQLQHQLQHQHQYQDHHQYQQQYQYPQLQHHQYSPGYGHTDASAGSFYPAADYVSSSFNESSFNESHARMHVDELQPRRHAGQLRPTDDTSNNYFTSSNLSSSNFNNNFNNNFNSPEHTSSNVSSNFQQHSAFAAMPVPRMHHQELQQYLRPTTTLAIDEILSEYD